VVRSRRKGEVMVQTGLRLEAEILDRLRGGKLGLSDEIRDRLQRTFREDELDPVVREVRDLVVELSKLAEFDYGRPWHRSARGHQEFMIALAAVLALYEPMREPGPPVASDLMEPDLDPASLGQIRAQDVRRWGSYPHLEAAAKRKTARLTSARHIKQEGSDE
jgi:hypothetical protein